jgi:CBS domain-containing protein
MDALLTARHLMTAPAVTVRCDVALLEALRLMLRKGISGLPVIDSNGLLVGIVTEGDLLRRAELRTDDPPGWWKSFFVGPGAGAREYAHSHARTVSSAMQRSVIAVERRSSLSTIVELMEKHRVRRLPVIDDGRVVGIVSRRDVMRKVADLMSEPAPGAPSDGELAGAIALVLGRLSWVPWQNLSIEVKDGAVSLSGVITDEAQREALKVAAQTVPGVKSVMESLALLNPYADTIVIGPPNTG